MYKKPIIMGLIIWNIKINIYLYEIHICTKEHSFFICNKNK